MDDFERVGILENKKEYTCSSSRFEVGTSGHVSGVLVKNQACSSPTVRLPCAVLLAEQEIPFMITE